MIVSTKTVKLLNKLFQAGYTDEKSVTAMTMDDILGLPGINVSEISLINELQKSIKAGKLLSFLGGGKTEEESLQIKSQG